jgi:hypothetical protein
MKTNIHKIISIIKDEQSYCKEKYSPQWQVLQNVIDQIAEDFPDEYENYLEETYDGPSDGEAWSGGFADNH